MIWLGLLALVAAAVAVGVYWRISTARSDVSQQPPEPEVERRTDTDPDEHAGG